MKITPNLTLFSLKKPFKNKIQLNSGLIYKFFLFILE